MPKYIPQEIKLKAMELFLRGDKTAKQIAEEVSTADHPVSPPTIYAWAKKDGWGEQKAVAVADKKQELAETEGQRFARLQAEQLDGYTVMANKAMNELNALHFDRALDATRAADIGIKGQREVLQGMINLQFVQDIMSVLVEEISDADQLQKIAVKLKTLVQQQEDI
tara:strand:- start:337 stop:837 length:501 start_codon:yes stop_codon:yes gene_type:complete